jgi:predicted RNase H-like HicB family nuclease
MEPMDALQLNAIFIKVPDGYVALVEELPGAHAQAKTLEEARKNLRQAVGSVLEANRILSEESLAGAEVTREVLAQF